MQRIQTLSTKLLNSTSAGELIRLRWAGETALAIVLDNNATGAILMIFHDHNNKLHITRKQLAGNQCCISYGAEWAIDLLDSDHVLPGKSVDTETRGLLLLDADEIWIAVPPVEDGFMETYSYYSLVSNKLSADTPERYTAFWKWRIWESKNAHLKQNSSPLLTVSLRVPRMPPWVRATQRQNLALRSPERRRRHPVRMKERSVSPRAAGRIHDGFCRLTKSANRGTVKSR